MITVIHFIRLSCFPGIHGLKSVLRSHCQSGGDVPVLLRRERYCLPGNISISITWNDKFPMEYHISHEKKYLGGIQCRPLGIPPTTNWGRTDLNFYTIWFPSPYNSHVLKTTILCCFGKFSSREILAGVACIFCHTAPKAKRRCRLIE
jgi:hypothetical protein